jgi:cytosine/adenosine deaminase-related metal-dependent hydrolase
MRSSTLSLAARYIFPVEGAPIADGLLTIDRGRIARVEPANGRTADLDLGNVALTPGFVNAHTHLELDPIAPDRAEGATTEDIVAWLRRVVEQRRARSVEGLRAAVDRNLAASLAAGTTLLADTTTAGLSWDRVASAPVRAVVFAELIGLKRERGLQTSEDAWTWLASVQPGDQVAACARPGLSPHAPYSTSGWLYHRAAASRLPLSTHLAEMPEELELLGTRSGPLREFLEDLGAWDDDWEPIGPRPGDYVRKGELRNADWVVAHGTYYDPSDYWQLLPGAAPEGHRIAVAYCPRTTARFGHEPHPFRALLRRGAIVCLGTDSLASAPTLSVLDEVRYLHRRSPSLGGPLLLTMATLFGAWALRAETTTGSLKPGKSADVAAIALPDRDAEDPHSLLLESDLPVVATVFEGDFVHGRWVGV